MRKILFPVILMVTVFLQFNLNAQKEPYEMIGKKIKDVIRTYGKPAYHDKSDPEMECVFYQTKSYRMVFVSNKTAVYQVEKCTFCGGKKVACNNFEKLLQRCKDNGFAADSLDTYEYNLVGDNVRLNIKVYENTVTNKFEVQMKASEREG